MRKYQVWVDDSKLIGHILCDDTDTVNMGDAVDYARRVWDRGITDAAVSICEIPSSYYQEIARSSAKESLELGF